MSEPFVGEIRMFASNFAPRGWAFCDGQLLAISQNDALFSLYGTIYGGDGRTTFSLPDMRGRIPLHQGTGPGLSSRRLGSRSGLEQVTLTINEIPRHSHNHNANTRKDNMISPVNNVLCDPRPGDVTEEGGRLYDDTDPLDASASFSSIGHTGGSQSHTNLMPTLCVNFIVALIGIYPPRN